MPKIQIAQFSKKQRLTDFVCDLFNSIENTQTYLTIGNNNNFRGIDSYSPEKQTAIQIKIFNNENSEINDKTIKTRSKKL